MRTALRSLGLRGGYVAAWTLVGLLGGYLVACSGSSSSSGDGGGSGSGSGSGSHAGSSSGSGSGTGSGSASSGSGSGTTSGSGSGCQPASTDFQSCTGDGECACGQKCIVDGDINEDEQSVCEVPCTSQSDCNDPHAPWVTCQMGYCRPVFCVQGFNTTVAGTFGQPCSLSGGAEGTCTPFFDLAGQPFVSAFMATNSDYIGLCFPLGTAASGDKCSDAVGASTLCSAGLICAIAPETETEPPAGAGLCTTDCAPGTNSTCGTGQVCLTFSSLDADLGFCGACVPSGSSCQATTDCCAGSCDSATGHCS